MNQVTLTVTVSPDTARYILELVESEAVQPSEKLLPLFATTVAQASRDTGLKPHEIYQLIHKNLIEHAVFETPVPEKDRTIMWRVVNLESLKRHIEKCAVRSALVNGQPDTTEVQR